MEPEEYTLIIILALLNLAAGFGCAVPISKLLRKINGKQKCLLRYLIILVVIYFVECVAFPAGMATQVFSVGLAFVWGIIFGFWLRNRASRPDALKTALFVSLYSTLPTASFCILIPIVMFYTDSHILSAEEGIGFGIPGFLPWPLNTILGFCTALLLGTVMLKTAITVGEVNLLVRLREQHQAKAH